MATQALHIGNMAQATTQATLTAAFAAYDPTNVAFDEKRGCGLLDVPEGRVAEIIDAMDGALVDGRAVSVREASFTDVDFRAFRK